MGCFIHPESRRRQAIGDRGRSPMRITAKIGFMTAGGAEGGDGVGGGSIRLGRRQMT